MQKSLNTKKRGQTLIYLGIWLYCKKRTQSAPLLRPGAKALKSARRPPPPCSQESKPKKARATPPPCYAIAWLQTCARFGFLSTSFARRKASRVLGQKACPHFARTHLVSCARSVFAPPSLRSPKSSRARPATTQYATQGGGAALTIYRPRHLCRGVGVCAPNL